MYEKGNSSMYLDGFEMGEYIKEKAGLAYSDYKKGQLFKKPIYEEEETHNPESYISNNAESLRLNAEKLVNHLEEVNKLEIKKNFNFLKFFYFKFKSIDSHEKVIEMEFKDEDAVSLSDINPKRKFKFRRSKRRSSKKVITN